MSKDYNHQPNGQFGPGNDGGPGRPKREVEREYLDTTIGAVSRDDWAAVVKSMLTFAKAGNVQAARWLADYILGRPVEQVNLSHDELDEITLTLPRLADEPQSPDGNAPAAFGDVSDEEYRAAIAPKADDHA